MCKRTNNSIAKEGWCKPTLAKKIIEPNKKFLSRLANIIITMTHKLAGVINYSIGIVLLTCALVLLKKKLAEQPGRKIYGLSLKTVIKLIYAGLAAFVLLIIAVLVGLE